MSNVSGVSSMSIGVQRFLVSTYGVTRGSGWTLSLMNEGVSVSGEPMLRYRAAVPIDWLAHAD